MSAAASSATAVADARAQALREQLQRAEQAMLAKRIGEATGICQDMLESAPDHPPALALLGAIAGHRGDLPRGIALLEQAIGADRTVASWFGNLSGLYRLEARLPEAVATAREALRLQPGLARHLVTLGKALMDSGEHTEAMAAFCGALAREPNHAEAHLAVGQMLLARGEFQPGWREYEWRNQLDQAKGTLPGMVAAAWNGMQLPNDRLLLIADQGFGDSLQFARFIPLAAARCQEVLLGCSADLMPLLGQLPGVGRSFSRWNEIPGHAAYCLLSSLPFLFNIEPDDLPGRRDYVAADPDRIAAWAARLGIARGRRVGIAWAGRPRHPNDRRRSMPLASLAPLAAFAGWQFISLQKPVPPQDQAAFAAWPGLVDHSAALTDFGETAALLANLDLVISVDTAILHLAGAMGRPAWAMLAEPADWRWMRARTDSPWYPSLRLFRQPHPGAWDGVVGDIASALGRTHIPVQTHQEASP